MMGAACKTSNKLQIVDEVSTEMENVTLSWVREPSGSEEVTLPVYLYRDRRNLLFTLNFNPEDADKTNFYKRSVAVTSNSALSWF